jgi:hypothetical protein
MGARGLKEREKGSVKMQDLVKTAASRLMDYEDKFEGEEEVIEFEYDPDWLKEKRKRK